MVNTKEEKDIKTIINEVKNQISNTQMEIFQNANMSLLKLYYNVGKIIYDHSEWGNKFIDEMERELKISFPNIKGFSVRNLKSMKKYYLIYSQNEKVQTASAQIPWSYNMLILDKMKNEIILFENQNLKLEVNMKDETVWLSLEQMAQLFDRDKSVISRHIKNALQEELNNEVVIANFATTTEHGAIEGKTQTHIVNYYNLDMIISVGYRVKSQNGIIFRRWANKTLKDYLLKGYVVNQKRLEYLEKTVKLIDIASRIDDSISNDNAQNIIKVINEYSKALNLLDDFDYNKISKPKTTKTIKEEITYEECVNVIKELSFNDNSSLFALERNKGLDQIINSIYSSFDNKDLYPSIEEKASNLLYLIVKDHAFIDGNKRIGATLFIYFLNKYNLLYKDNEKVIDNNTLACMTILIAQSNPKEKGIIIDLIMNFLCEK